MYETESYCLKCKKNNKKKTKQNKKTKNIDPKVTASSNGRAMVLSKCAICGSKNSRLIKNKGAKGLLSKLGLKTPLNKEPILGDILFRMQFH